MINWLTVILKFCICTVGLKTFKNMNFQRWEVIPVQWSRLYLWSSQNLLYLFSSNRNLKNFTRSDEKASSYDMIWRSSRAGGHGDGSDRDYPPEEQSHFLKPVFGSQHYSPSLHMSLHPLQIFQNCGLVHRKQNHSVWHRHEQSVHEWDGFQDSFTHFCSLDWGSHFCLTLCVYKRHRVENCKISFWLTTLSRIKSSSASNAFSWSKVLLFCSVAVGQSIFLALNKWALCCKSKEFLQN